MVLGARAGRWLPGLMVALGFVFAFSLLYIELPWFFFGVGFAASGLAMCLLTGGELGLKPIQSRVSKWVTVWPIWEYAVLGTVAIGGLIAAFWFGVWAPMLMGGLVGLVIPAIAYLTVGMSMADRRSEVTAKFGKLVQDLTDYGLTTFAIEGGMPKLMGENWIPLFENHFGYAAYRSIAQQISEVEPELLGRRPRIRDFLADAIAGGTRTRQGMITTAWNVRQERLRKGDANKTLAELRSADSPSDADRDGRRRSSVQGEIVAGSEENQIDRDGNPKILATDVSLRTDSGHGGGGSAKLAGTFNIHSLSAENLSIHLSGSDVAGLSDGTSDSRSGARAKRRGQYEEMMQEARSQPSLGKERASYEKKMNRYLSDESRLGVSIVMAIVFCCWTYQSGLLSGQTWTEFSSAITRFDIASLSAIGESFGRLADSLTRTEASVWPIGVSGWGIGLAAILVAISSGQEGWRYSIFAYAAALLVVAGFSISLVLGQSSIVAWSSVALAVITMVGGATWVRKRRAKIFGSV